MLRDLRIDVLYAVRKLRGAPWFASVAIGTIAVAVGVITTIFSFVNAVYLRPLPYPGADRIAAIGQEIRGGYWNFSEVLPAVTRELVRPNASFDRVSVYHSDILHLVSGTAAQQVWRLAVDTSFQAMFHLQPSLGRFLSRDEIVGGAAVAVISDTLWHSHFGSDPAILGKTLDAGEQRYAIVGVLPPGFRYPYQTDVIVPLPTPVLPMDAEDNGVSVIARLRPGVSRETAQAELNVIAARVERADSAANPGLTLSLRDEMLDRRARSFLPIPSVFLAAGALLLLVACSNVANLFLARAAERRSEIAVRASLGASRWRLARQMITESLVVAAIASAAGTVLSVWLVRICLSLIPTRGFPSWVNFGVDGRVLGFAVAVAFLVTILVGLEPAREGTRFDLTRALKVGGDAGVGRAGVRRSSRRGVVVQLAMAMVLFVAAGLLVRSYARLMHVDLGYPAEQVAEVDLFFDQAMHPEPEEQMQFVEQLLPRAAALPGARVVTARGDYGGPRTGVAPATPVRRNGRSPDRRIFVDGDTTFSPSRGISRRLFAVADKYFQAVGLRLIRGRALERGDAAGSTPVVVVSRTFADRMLGDRDPLGRTIQVGASGIPYTVIGIVEDVRDIRGGRNGITSVARADAHFSARQARAFQYKILARASDEASALALHQTIATMARSAAPSLITTEARTMASQIDEMTLITKVFGGLIGACAITALLLALVGVYAVIAYSVSQRTREVGVRIALGGTAAMIVGMIVREALRFVSLGLLIGLVIAAALTRVLSAILFGVSSLDWPTYLVAGTGFLAVALLACWLPARRVSRVDALAALRAE